MEKVFEIHTKTTPEGLDRDRRPGAARGLQLRRRHRVGVDARVRLPGDDVRAEGTSRVPWGIEPVADSGSWSWITVSRHILHSCSRRLFGVAERRQEALWPDSGTADAPGAWVAPIRWNRGPSTALPVAGRMADGTGAGRAQRAGSMADDRAGSAGRVQPVGRCPSTPSRRVTPGTVRARKSSTIAVCFTRSSMSNEAWPVEYVYTSGCTPRPRSRPT